MYACPYIKKARKYRHPIDGGFGNIKKNQLIKNKRNQIA